MNLLWSIVLLGTALVVSSSALNLPGVPNSFTSEERLTSAISATVADEITSEYIKYMQTGTKSLRLLELGSQLSVHSDKNIFTKPLLDLGSGGQFAVCTLCRAAINVVGRTFLAPGGELNGPNRDELSKKFMLDFCDLFSIQTPEVCSGVFDLNWPIIDYIMKETVGDSRSMCSMLPIPICQVQQEEFNFTLNIQGAMPTESNSELPARSADDSHILHLTDIHYDPEYLAGGDGDCAEPMCCRNPMPTGSTSKPAGFWSDYRDCDTPRHLIVNAFEHIRDNQKVDWIYHTGDVPPHNVWSTTKQGNIDMLTDIDGLMTQHFPNKPVYSCLGNHEPHPTNVFGHNDVPAELSVDWLYSHIWSLWKKFLPAEAETTVRKGGYYSVSPKAGHRIIALNSMDCYLFNWWLFLDGSIMIEQLQWFHDQLLAAETAGEYVHVLSHIPAGDGDCWTVWAREYNRILWRFNKIITGIFSGHTHKDEMNLHYTDEGLAMAVNWNGGSLTSFSYKNPNYRLYEVNSKTLQVLEHHTWLFNLTAANVEDGKPEWYEEYAFTKEFTEDTSPAGIDKLLVEMAKKPSLLRKFWRYKMTSADPKLSVGCDDSCMLATICRIATTNYEKKTRCRELQAILKEHLPDEEPPTEPEDEDDGAASLTAYSLTLLLGLVGAFSYLL